MTSADLLSWLFEASVVLAAAALMVLLVRRVAHGRVGAVWIYALWLALPVALAASIAPNGFVASPFSLTVGPNAAGLFGRDAIYPSAAGTERAVALAVNAGLAMWLTGAAGFLLWTWRAQRRFERGVIAPARRPTHAEARELAEAAAGTTLDPNRDFRFTGALDGPLACGLTRPVVLLPEQFLTRYTAGERRVMVLHEAEHIGGCHLQHRAAAAVLRSLFWFHPLIWLSERAFLADQEMACDGAVLGRDAAIRPQAYAETLLKVAGDIAGPAPRLPAASVPLIGISHLKGRTAMLVRHASLRNTRAAGLCMVSVATAAAVLTGLSAAAPGRAQSTGAESPARLAGSGSPLPAYPLDALENALEGECVIGFDVAADGTTENVHSLGCTVDRFEDPSIEWIRNSRYDAETTGGARDQRVTIVFEYPEAGEAEPGAETD